MNKLQQWAHWHRLEIWLAIYVPITILIALGIVEISWVWPPAWME